MDLRISIVIPRRGPNLAMTYISRGDLRITPPLTSWELQASRVGLAQGVPGGLMFHALCRLKEPASEYHLGMALVVAAVALGLMLWAIIWQASIIDFQRDLIRLLSTGHFGGTV
jgi:hypothetical protein